MIRSLLLLAAILSVVPIAAYSQNQQQAQRRKVKIDVKTQLVEKVELSPIKAGVIAAIDSSTWGEVVEIDEHYSLWIKAPLRQPLGKDSMMITVQLELRTPAMFRDGKFINSSTLSMRYALKDTLMNLAPFMEEYLSRLHLLDSVVGLTKKYIAGTGILQSPPMTVHAVIGLAATHVLNVLHTLAVGMTRQKLLEGVLVFSHAMPSILGMVKAEVLKK